MAVAERRYERRTSSDQRHRPTPRPRTSVDAGSSAVRGGGRVRLANAGGKRPAAQPLLAPPASSCCGRPLPLAGGPARSLFLVLTRCLPVCLAAQTRAGTVISATWRIARAGPRGSAVTLARVDAERRPPRARAQRRAAPARLSWFARRGRSEARIRLACERFGNGDRYSFSDPPWRRCDGHSPSTPCRNAPLAKITHTSDVLEQKRPLGESLAVVPLFVLLVPLRLVGLGRGEVVLGSRA
jgi:hypothetical protein